MAPKGTYKLSVEQPTDADVEESKRRRMKWSNLYTYSCARPFIKFDEATSSLGREGFSRVVLIGRQDEHPVWYPSNWVATTKYNLLTFFPKALYEQFRRIANIYFLLAAALSLTPVSPFSAASLIAPLVFVVGVSMLKEAIEDWHRFLQASSFSSSFWLFIWGKEKPIAESIVDLLELILDEDVPMGTNT
ncbi:hypothetical protein GOP47_0012114 [Adiantum capillus-veneris]|uniref:P-type ATPase N-terminal domain-containing protein n=1 Tax=Adiantum capillus-veneris TaxID=13818 RepID=A0A9D4ZE04_ADICA|nr:hypothetical protein GOP47_0012114 [Adiantum capillus-veneris]